MKPKTIIAVLDSSSAAKDAALTRALSLAHGYEADLHVVQVRPGSRISERTSDPIRHELVTHVARVAESSGTGGINITPAVLSGRPVRAIADYTDRVAADLVVVGSNARRSGGYWSAGSFAAALGRAVTSPTIAVPNDGAESTHTGPFFRNILAAIDFSDASLRALSEALVLAQRSAGHLRLLHVLDGFPYETVYSGARAVRLIDDLRAHVRRANRALQSLIPPDAWHWCAVEVSTVSGKAHEAIVAAASERRTDLLVLGLPRRPRLEEFASRSTAPRVLRRATSPVLLVPGPSRSALFRPADERDVQLAAHPSAFGVAATRETSREGKTSWR